MRYAPAAGILSLLLIGASAAAGQEPEWRRHFLAARRAQDAGDLDTAAAEYRTVVKLQPGFAEGYLNLGLVYHVQARFEDSIHALEKAVSLKPGVPGANLYLGIGLTKLNRPSLAVPALQKAVSQEPDSKDANTWLATALWDSGRTGEALGQLERTAGVFPADVDVLFLLGEAYRKSAARELEAIMNAAAGSPLTHRILAESYAAREQWDKAAWHYRRAIEQDPRLTGAHRGLGGILERQGKAAEAAALFREESEIRAPSPAPGSLESKYQLARRHEEQSLATLTKLLSIAPDSYRAHQLRAQTHEAREGYQEALAEYRKVAEIRPTLPGLHFAIGHLLWKSGHRDEALVELEQELKRNPDHAEANAELGTIRVTDHQPEQAIPYLERALRLKPDLAEASRQLGKAYFQQQRYALAEAELRKAIVSDRDGSVHYMLGTVYRQLGRQQDSERAMEAARRIKAERLAEVREPGSSF